jgi:hypothetical protein
MKVQIRFLLFSIILCTSILSDCKAKGVKSENSILSDSIQIQEKKEKP